MTMTMAEMTEPLAPSTPTPRQIVAPFNALAFLIGVTIYGF